jgi:hypothetical protein
MPCGVEDSLFRRTFAGRIRVSPGYMNSGHFQPCGTNKLQHERTLTNISKPSIFKGIISMHCPACRQGKIFIDPNPYHLSKMGDMYEKCEVCGQLYRPEPGFYFGAAYVSYVMMVALLVVYCAVYYLIFNELGGNMLRLMGFAILLVSLVAPAAFRFSRIIYLYIMVRYKGRK